MYSSCACVYVFVCACRRRVFVCSCVSSRVHVVAAVVFVGVAVVFVIIVSFDLGWWVFVQLVEDEYGLVWRAIVAQEIVCPNGYEIDLNSTEGSCSVCPAGKSSTEEELGCVTCAHGSVATLSGMSTCDVCVAGKYAEDGIVCSKCQSPATSKHGSAVCDLCIADYYFNDKTGKCEKCPGEGVFCPENSRDFIVKNGYWRTTDESYVVEACLHQSSCEGARRNSSGSDLCTSGTMGVMCAVCEEDRFRSSGGTCDVCTGSEIATFFLVLCIIITLVFGVSITARKMQKHMMNTHAEESHATEILKVLWATYQILASFRWQLGVVFPMPFTGVQTIIGVQTLLT